MLIHLKFFASLREALGTAQESLELPGDVQTAGQVRDYLRARGGDRKSTRLNSSHVSESRMPSSA